MSSFIPPFLNVDIAITNRCDASCAYCPCPQTPGDGKDELPAEDWIRLVDRLSKLTKLHYVCIGGGEPLLYQDLCRVIGGIAKRGIDSVVVTSGASIDEGYCRRLVGAGVSRLVFSLDGLPALHDELRGIPGLAHRCAEAIFTLKELKPELELALCTLLAEPTLAGIPELVGWAQEALPISAITFQAYNNLELSRGRPWTAEEARADPMWPQDPHKTAEILDWIREQRLAGARIANDPVQLENFKRYFEDPTADLKVRCPAGAFAFSVSHDGSVNGCILEEPVGNITRDDPVTLYQQRFGAVRQRARTCDLSCHYLVNCLNYVTWKDWESQAPEEAQAPGEAQTSGEAQSPEEAQSAGEAAAAGEAPAPGEAPLSEVSEAPAAAPVHSPPGAADLPDDLRSGQLLLPPEIRGHLASADLRRRYRKLLRYEERRQHDTIGADGDPEQRQRPAVDLDEMPVVYLCGHTSEAHRWGVDHDENDFFKQLDALEQLSRADATHHVMVGVRRTNFHRLVEIYDLVRRVRGQEEVGLSDVNPGRTAGLCERFHRRLADLNKMGEQEGINFHVVDPQLDELLHTIERAPSRHDYDHGDLMRALGPVCKDVFIGPKHILFDLSSRCNADCVYCRCFTPWIDPALTEKPDLPPFIPQKVIRRSLEEAKELGVENVLLVGRGEPTLHPDFRLMLDLVADAEMTYTIVTNGVLLDRHMDQLLDGNCESLTISLSYASDETFRKIRPGTKPKFRQRIDANVRALSQRKAEHGIERPRINALYALCKYNYLETLEMAHHAKEIGADIIWYQLIHCAEFTRDRLGLSPEEMQVIREQLRQAREVAREAQMGWHSFIDFEMEHYNEERQDWSHRGLLHQGCYVGWNFAYLSLTGEITFCCGQSTVGLQREDGGGLAEAWHSPAYARYRNDGLILHRENPLDLYGVPLYNEFCDSCDNHDQNTAMITMVQRYDLQRFVER